MFNQFSPTAQHQPQIELIPNGTLAFVQLNVQKLANSQSTGGQYVSLELTVDRGPYERRKIFTMVGDPSDSKNSEKYQQMSLASLQHMLEASGVFNPAQPESYSQFANKGFVQILEALDGKTVAIKIKIEKGQDGYADKNQVADWLSPNPASRSYKQWQQLVSGGGVPAQPVQQQALAWGAGAIAQQGAVNTPVGASPSPTTASAPVGSATPAWLQKQS